MSSLTNTIIKRNLRGDLNQATQGIKLTSSSRSSLIVDSPKCKKGCFNRMGRMCYSIQTLAKICAHSNMPPKRSSCRQLPQLASLRSCNDHLPRPKLNLRVRRLRLCTLNKIVAAPVVVAQSLVVYIRLLLCNSSKISNSLAVATALCRRMFSSLRSPFNHRTNPSTRHSPITQLSRPFSKARSDSCKCFLKTRRLMLRNQLSYELT